MASKFLAMVTKGKLVEPIFGIVYGDEGVGKTTLGAGLPDVIFIGPEAAKRFDVARMPEPKSFSEMMGQLIELRDEKHEFKSICIDSLDWTELLLHDEVKKSQSQKSIEDCYGGYGKWVNGLVAKWKEMIDLLCEIRNKRGMHIMLLAHYQVKKFDNPMTALPYDRYMMKLYNERHSSLWREAVDFVFLATYDTQSYSSDKNAKKGRGLGGEARVVYTEKRASHDAKNRLGLPYKLPLDIQEILKKINETEADQLVTLQKDFEAMLLDITDPTLLENAKATYEKTKGNLANLKMVKNRLAAAMGQTSGEA
jgi:hypothetical protein